MRLILGFLICFFISSSVFAVDLSKQEIITRVERTLPEAKEPQSLINHALQKWEKGEVGPFTGLVWDEAETLYSTQVILYNIFEQLLTKDPSWISFFNKTKARFVHGTWQKADSQLRHAYATALAFLATNKLEREHFLTMASERNLMALVESWFRVFDSIIFNERIFENWDLSVIYKINGVSKYKSELQWMLDSLMMPEDGVQVFTPETLNASGTSFLSSQPDFNLNADESKSLAGGFLRGFPKEKDFIDFISTTQTRLGSRLKKPGLRKIYQALFGFYKEALIQKQELILAAIESQKSTAAQKQRLEEQAIPLAIEFTKAIEQAAGPAEHFKFRRQKLADAAMELFAKDVETPWAEIFKNSKQAHLVLYVVQRIYADPQLQAMIQAHYHLDSILTEIVPVKLKLKKEGEPRVETRYPPEKCSAVLRLI